MATPRLHTPVLLEEVLAALEVEGDVPGSRDGLYLDATFGRGGHTTAILDRLGPNGRVIALDRDPQAIAAGRADLSMDSRLTLIHSAFGDLAKAVGTALGNDGLGKKSWSGVFNGVLFDLGVSSPQLDDASRGFSFSHDGPLDMRMDNTTGPTAATWLANAAEHDIARVLREYGEERFARRIAHAIVISRSQQPITTTAQLAALISAAVPMREHGKHPATRSFQAIRIQVNAELQQIESALGQSIDLLAPGGRLCAISFHSLEDRIVKQFMQRNSQEDPVYAGLPDVPAHARPRLKRVGRAIHSSDAEIACNPRSRSAIMRVAERLAS